jgi:CheY-like chemotaxis protein/two-component sensor histidine kinase
VNALQIIRLEGRQTPDLERALEAAERQADHMVGMIDDLLDVARITRGKIQLRKDTVALASIMETAVQASRQLILDKRHDLRLVMPEQAVFVQADPMRLSQIVSNLVNNAGRYTADGGKIEVTCEVEGRELAIHVRDSGIGISAEMIEHIFDSFVQVSPTSDRSAGGLGIGLTLVRTLAELHGGTAYAFSEGRGRGSEFIVRLPVVTQEEPRPVSNTQVRHSGAVPANDARLVIALVDDNDDIRFTMRALLELWGHRVEEAFDGPSGIDLIERVQPHLALVDLGLPGYDGFEVARRAAELTASRTFLIALSGYGGEDVEQRAREVGFFAHLLKPIDPRRLLALLKVMQEAPGSGEALKQRALSPGA